MILFYAFDREMLNAAGFLEKDIRSRNAIEMAIECELKTLVFIMPLDERVVISPSFRFESEMCRRILMRNREFIESGVIAEYRREASIEDFWAKKNETYRGAMDISGEYRKVYGQKEIYNEVSSLWIDRVPKQKVIGQVSRDTFMLNIKEQGRKYNVPTEQIDNVLKVTDETREDTFLWEVEAYMLSKYGISDDIVRRLGVREAMNLSYLDVFASQDFDLCKSSLGLANIEHMNPSYDMLRIKPILERLGILKVITSLPAERLLYIRSNPEVQAILEVLREHIIVKDESLVTICNAVNNTGELMSLITKLMIHTSGDTNMNTFSEQDDMLKKNTSRILHLSDLHFTDEKAMTSHYFYLKLDLTKNFHISKIDYLVISGDVCNIPDKDLYKIALSFVQMLSKDFAIPVENLILVPGNHDCDRNTSKKAYDKREQNIVDKDVYDSRYSSYSKYFYEQIKKKPYPMKPIDQFEDFVFASDGLCFLGLNSCWQIDHKNPMRSSICIEAIQKSASVWLDTEDYVKIAVWHHPLSGWASIQDTTFMDTLATAGFKACFHGHIHEAKNELFSYDAHHSIKMIGAGTFGAIQKDRGEGIPLQYNLIEFDKERRHLIVHTRKREKSDGMWQADARWDNKNHNPKSFYTVDCST